MSDHPQTPREKALKVNLDPLRYGTFAEIGAGQEVVRWFFQVGAAAGTISKSMSAYDMEVSDAIYGKCSRYVCRERLESMLDHEHTLNTARLSEKRGDTTAFFSFADTVSARNYHGTNECHGWMGIRFQSEPGSPVSQIIIHVRMLDLENALQQDALGVVGVNLIYGAFFLSGDPSRLIESLLDSLSVERIEIDMIEFAGDAFAAVDNRVMSLRLVQLGLTGAAMFAADGTVLQPSEFLRKKSILIERGRFRPLTHVHIDMLNAALAAFKREPEVSSDEVVPVMEITMRHLMTGDDVDLSDFISRTEVLATTGHTVLISDYFEYYRLAAYLGRYTSGRIGLALGAGSLKELFAEGYYTQLGGGILESFGRLFKNDLRLYVYPYQDRDSRELTTVETLKFPEPLGQLYSYLVARRCIVPLTDVKVEHLPVQTDEVLEMILRNDAGWDELVPASVALAIRSRGLFGYREG